MSEQKQVDIFDAKLTKWIGGIVPRYLTEQHLGKLLPRGWAVENLNGWYVAFLGEEVAMPPMRTLEQAIISAHAYLNYPIYRAACKGLVEVVQMNLFDVLDERKGGA